MQYHRAGWRVTKHHDVLVYLMIYSLFQIVYKHIHLKVGIVGKEATKFIELSGSFNHIFARLSRLIMTEVFKSSNIPDSNLRGGIHIENHIM